MNEKYKGMTVNERLFTANLDKAFYKAEKERNVEKMIAILKEVDFTDESINPIIENFKLKRS